MCSVAEEEVQPLVDVLDVDTLAVSSSSQDQLLKVQEGTLVRNMLTDLQAQQHRANMSHLQTEGSDCHEDNARLTAYST